MMRSLFSGISGLGAHQVKMDVISDNIANVNTTGFKKSRVIFSNIFNETIGYPSAPGDNIGGINPKQIGLGVQTAAIDRIMGQGSTETTGNVSDVAIEGNGFFIVDDGQKDVYTRAGNFQIDSTGDFVHGSTGYRVQGWPAKWNDTEGEFQVNTGGVLEPINFLDLEKLSAKATKNMVFKSNLMANSNLEDGSPDSRFFTDENTMVYGVKPNEEEISFKMQKRSKNLYELRAFDNDGNAIDMDQSTATFDSVALVHVYDDGRIKSIEVDGNFDIYSMPGVNSVINGGDNFVFTLSPAEPPAANYWTFRDINNEEQKLNIVYEKDVSSNSVVDVYRWKVYDEDGNLLDMNGDAIAEDSQDYGTMSIISETGKIANVDTRIAASPAQFNVNGVTLDLSVSPDSRQMLFTELSTGSQREIPLGSEKIDITRDGTSQAISFNINSGVQHSTSLVVYDSQGTPHELTTNFEKTDENEWRYWLSLGMDDPVVTDYLEKFPNAIKDTENPTEQEKKNIMKSIFWDSQRGYVGQGVLKFNEIGRIDREATRQANGVSYPDLVQVASFTSPGAEQLDINFDMLGITQFDSEEFTTAARSQDGYEMGMLNGYYVDTSGQIVGSYTNDRSQVIGQLALAMFQNPSGLEKLSGSVWTTSGNSGNAVVRIAGTGGAGTFVGGKLEMSNVDLSEEFTAMIIAQRGFQANSRSITTADQLLQELVNLKR
ncbi:MAG: hypothetical protein C0601_04825 [Candidatus Muiribacterium halophilum]|uniref:Flagellar hook protein FlgE n=1 Tax=Muiribacterium halophilum TaxID=2053465 RepID=A0A2N5ZI86_MUIH1|nr:MAG: hypothetical protein C0601_04825 [Candidatus Muirbacterium halophilum]